MATPSAHDEKVLAVLRARDGQSTLVHLVDGRTADVRNIAWGYDDGSDSAHITSNVSPPERPDRGGDFFLTNEVLRIEDPHSPGADLLRA